MTRVIGIVGSSNSGSTILGNILGNLPDVVNVGESHWLHKADTMASRPEWAGQPYPCRACGTDCGILSPITKWTKDDGPWWEAVSAAYGNPEFLVSTDKNKRFFDQYGLPDAVILLYRDPVYWAKSWAERHEMTPQEAAGVWARLYERALKWLDKRDLECVSVNWSEFRADTSSFLPRFVNVDGGGMACGMVPAEALDWNNGQHFVGGNRHLHPGITKEKRHGYDQATVDSIRAITAEVEEVLHAG